MTPDRHCWRALTLVAWLIIGPGSAKDSVKVISSKEVTQDEIKAAESDFGTRDCAIETAKLPKSKVKQNHLKKMSITVEAEPRSSGGITVELFCRDNTGVFMPVWGGSITQAVSDWDFTDADIRKDCIDGCYFAVVDSTAEMEAMS